MTCSVSSPAVDWWLQSIISRVTHSRDYLKAFMWRLSVQWLIGHQLVLSSGFSKSLCLGAVFILSCRQWHSPLTHHLLITYSSHSVRRDSSSPVVDSLATEEVVWGKKLFVIIILFYTKHASFQYYKTVSALEFWLVKWCFKSTDIKSTGTFHWINPEPLLTGARGVYMLRPAWDAGVSVDNYSYRYI